MAAPQTVSEDVAIVTPETPELIENTPHVEEVVYGGVNLRLTILDRRLLEASDRQAVIAQWISGVQPLLGMVIEGWQGPETVMIKQIGRSQMMIPDGVVDGRTEHLMQGNGEIRKVLDEHGINVKRLPSNHPAMIEYHSSANTNRPKLYGGKL